MLKVTGDTKTWIQATSTRATSLKVYLMERASSPIKMEIRMKDRSCMDRSLDWEFTNSPTEILISAVFIIIKAMAKEKSCIWMLHTMRESGNWVNLVDLVNSYGLMEKYIRDSIWKDLNTAKENLHSKTMVGMKVSGRMACSLERVNIAKDMTRLKARGKKVNLKDDR
jgi:hypothetical protein